MNAVIYEVSAEMGLHGFEMDLLQVLVSVLYRRIEKSQRNAGSLLEKLVETINLTIVCIRLEN